MRRSWTVATLVVATLLLSMVTANEDIPTRVVNADSVEKTSSIDNKPKECPKIDPTDRTIHLPHEWDCTKFYKCDHGNRVLFQCPVMDSNGNRLHFNPILEVCDWPEHAGCIDGSPPTTTDKSTDGDIKSTQSTTTIRTPNSANITTKSSSEHTTTESSSTSKETSNSSPTNTPTTVRSTWHDVSTESSSKRTTTESSIYSTTIKTSWPDTSAGSSSISSSEFSTISSTENTTPLPTDATTDHSSNPTPSIHYIPHESNCSLFYEVINGVKIIGECPVGLHFSPTTMICTWPEYAGCELTTVTAMTTTTPSNPTCGLPCMNGIEHGSLVPHECLCEKYYRCSNGDLILQQCPNGLHFNSNIYSCDYPNSAGCSTTTPQSSTDQPTTSMNIPSECPADNSGHTVQFPHPTNCSLFYKCDNGQKQLMQCPNGLYFNPRIEMCDWPASAGCTATSNPENSSKPFTISTLPNLDTSTEDYTRENTGSTATNTLPSECPSDNSGTAILLPNPYNCTLYYICDNGQKVSQSCSSGLEFNPQKQVCDWPGSSGCSANTLSSEASRKPTRPSGKTTENIATRTTTIVVPTECPNDNSGYALHLPYPYNCSLYYKCDNGQKVVQFCPPGLEFNAREQVCDWPGSAGCVVSTTEIPLSTLKWTTASIEPSKVSTTTPNTSSGNSTRLPKTTIRWITTPRATSTDSTNSATPNTSSEGSTRLPETTTRLTTTPKASSTDSASSTTPKTSSEGSTRLPVTTTRLTTTPKASSTDSASSTTPNTSSEGSTRLPETTTRLTTTPKASSTDSASSTTPNTSSEGSTRLPETTTRLTTTRKASSTDSASSTTPNTSSEGSTRLPETTTRVTTTRKASSTDSASSTTPNTSSEGSTRLPETTTRLTTTPKASSTDSASSTTPNTSSEGSTRLPETTTRLTTTPKASSTDSASSTTPNTSSEGSTRLPETTTRLTTTPKVSSTDSASSTTPNTSSEGSTRLSETTTRLTTTPKASSTDSASSTTPNTSSEGSTRLPETTTRLTTTPKASSTDSASSTTPNTSSEGSSRLPETTTRLTTTSKVSSTDSASSTTPNTSSDGSTRLPETTTRLTTTQKASSTDSTSSTTPKPAYVCPPDANGLQIPHETNCSLYYECEGGEKILKECTPGLQFSPILELCVWPANAGCQSTTISRDSSSTIADDNGNEKSSSSSTTMEPITTESFDTSASGL